LNALVSETEKIQNGSKKMYPEKIESKTNIPRKIPIENMRYFELPKTSFNIVLCNYVNGSLL